MPITDGITFYALWAESAEPTITVTPPACGAKANPTSSGKSGAPIPNTGDESRIMLLISIAAAFLLHLWR